MPDTLLPVAEATWDDVYRRLIEDNDPVLRMDREREFVFYSLDRGVVLVLGKVGLVREDHAGGGDAGQ